MKDFWSQAIEQLTLENNSISLTDALILERAEKLKAEFLAKGTP
jgi:hypothetical protein